MWSDISSDVPGESYFVETFIIVDLIYQLA